MTVEIPYAKALSDPLRARIVLAVAAFLAYLPALTGQFVFDDTRFVRDNRAVHELSIGNLGRYFSDPSTMASETWQGIYRPLRTLDFAIDWAISGGRPWFFHLKNLLYHILTGILLYSLLRRLLPAGDRTPLAALAGALVYILHPVQVESVAWISSRGDVLLGFLTIAALLLHVRGRAILAAGLLLLALFAKESAVVFPALVFLVDRLRRAKPNWPAYGAYAALAVGYFFFWRWMNGDPRHLAGYWGGSYGANLLTMGKGFLHYVRVILLPVDFTVDWHVPVATGVDAGSAFAALAVTALVVAALAAGRRSRFAALWFLAALLPVSNLLIPIGIPTAERFLYLPLVGVVLWAAPILVRSRHVLTLLACLFLLTFVRSFSWRTNEALFDAALDVADTPRALAHRLDRELKLATAANRELAAALPLERPRHERRVRAHAERVVDLAERLVRLYDEEIRLPPADLVAMAMNQKSNALLLLGRPAEALDSADRALRIRGDLAEGFYNAGHALLMLGERKGARANFRKAAELWRRKAAELRSAGKGEAARTVEGLAAQADQLAASIG